MKCMSKEWIHFKVGDSWHKKKCDKDAIKQCRHGFATCDKHFHGCKNE